MYMHIYIYIYIYIYTPGVRRPEPEDAEEDAALVGRDHGLRGRKTLSFVMVIISLCVYISLTLFTISIVIICCTMFSFPWSRAENYCVLLVCLCYD